MIKQCSITSWIWQRKKAFMWNPSHYKQHLIVNHHMQTKIVLYMCLMLALYSKSIIFQFKQNWCLVQQNCDYYVLYFQLYIIYLIIFCKYTFFKFRSYNPFLIRFSHIQRFKSFISGLNYGVLSLEWEGPANTMCSFRKMEISIWNPMR